VLSGSVFFGIVLSYSDIS